MSAVTEFSPAKINLFLAVTGRRADGFHDLVSLAAPLAWGDDLSARPSRRPGEYRLRCDDPSVPPGEENLVLKAARAYAAAVSWRSGVDFELAKRIPTAAGLGGGSSNAVAALFAMDRLTAKKLSRPALGAIAASLGSDCPLFLSGGPVVMRGRGERIEPTEGAGHRLRGRRVLLFKPGFGVSTSWAYSALAASDGAYTPAAEAESRLAGWLSDKGAPVETLLFNSFERPVFRKYPALPALFDRLRGRFGLHPALSGSGSAAFCLWPPAGGPSAEEVTGAILEAWGESALVVDTRLG